MSLPPRFAPPTQLDALRALLSSYSDGDRHFQAQFEKSLKALRQLALPECGQRLASATTPSGLRRRILEATATFDWPEWDRYLVPMLQREEDLSLFNEGCAALGGLCNASALGGLQGLKELRQDPERQQILDRELGRYQPEQSFGGCLDALMTGKGNPELARKGARWLAALAGPQHLDALQEVFHLGDALTRHLTLHLVAFIQDPAADAKLLTLFYETELEFLQCQPLAEFAGQLEALHGKAQRELLLAKFGECFGSCPPETLQALREHLLQASPGGAPSLDGVQAEAFGPLKSFLFRALSLLIQGKSLGFEALIREGPASVPTLEAECAARWDDLAGLLAAKVDQQQLPLEQVLPLLENAFHAVSAGGEGLLVAYLRLIPGTDQERLDRILAVPDGAKRMRCIEVLGAREEDLLAPFFLQAMRDPLKEAGQLAMHQLGKLPSGLPGMLDLFRSEEADRVRVAIRFFAENHTKAAVKALMAFLSSESSDDLLVDAARALGNIQDPASTNALLRQLHAGKPLALQASILEALGQLGTPEASLGILKKSEELTLPEVLLLSLKGSLSAFPSFEQPLPPPQVPALEHLVERCCDIREGAGRWLDAALVVQELFVFDAGLYRRLMERFTAFLIEMRQRPFWDRKTHDLVSEVIKKLSRRVARLSTLEEQERALLDAIASIPEVGPRRMQVFFQLREALSEPELALSEACSQALVAFLGKELLRGSLDFSELDFLCRIAGLSGQPAMIEPLDDLLAHGRSPEVRGAARKALVALGVSPQQLDGRKPIQSILLLEPNTFFRNRMIAALKGSQRSLEVAATREEAEGILAQHRVDLLISEGQDGVGELWAWLEGQWDARHCHYVLISTSIHDSGPLADKPWVIGRLYKPYPLEELVRSLEA